MESIKLLCTDLKGSVLKVDRVRLVYQVHGFCDVEATSGYAGQLMEPMTAHYSLGSYRSYNPVLRVFHSPDAWSPFDRGGLNAYAYCNGDPVNSSDPDGHALIPDLVRRVMRAVLPTSVKFSTRRVDVSKQPTFVTYVTEKKTTTATFGTDGHFSLKRASSIKSVEVIPTSAKEVPKNLSTFRSFIYASSVRETRFSVGWSDSLKFPRTDVTESHE